MRAIAEPVMRVDVDALLIVSTGSLQNLQAIRRRLWINLSKPLKRALDATS
jgi:hypothetical protein